MLIFLSRKDKHDNNLCSFIIMKFTATMIHGSLSLTRRNEITY